MTETLILKVVCGSCGNKIGEAYRDGSAVRYRPVFPGRADTADTVSIPSFWCADDGFASAEEVERFAAEAAAAATGGPVTRRAHVARERGC